MSDSPDGDWVTIEVLGTEEEAELIAGFLRSEGVEARVHSLRFHQEPVNFGGLGEVQVRVLANDLDRGRALLAEQRSAAEASADDDGESDGSAGEEE